MKRRDMLKMAGAAMSVPFAANAMAGTSQDTKPVDGDDGCRRVVYPKGHYVCQFAQKIMENARCGFPAECVVGKAEETEDGITPSLRLPIAVGKVFHVGLDEDGKQPEQRNWFEPTLNEHGELERNVEYELWSHARELYGRVYQEWRELHEKQPTTVFEVRFFGNQTCPTVHEVIQNWYEGGSWIQVCYAWSWEFRETDLKPCSWKVWRESAFDGCMVTDSVRDEIRANQSCGLPSEPGSHLCRVHSEISQYSDSVYDTILRRFANDVSPSNRAILREVERLMVLEKRGYTRTSLYDASQPGNVKWKTPLVDGVARGNKCTVDEAMEILSGVASV